MVHLSETRYAVVSEGFLPLQTECRLQVCVCMRNHTNKSTVPYVCETAIIQTVYAFV